MNNKVEVFRPVILIKNYGFRVFQRKTEKVFFINIFGSFQNIYSISNTLSST